MKEIKKQTAILKKAIEKVEQEAIEKISSTFNFKKENINIAFNIINNCTSYYIDIIIFNEIVEEIVSFWIIVRDDKAIVMKDGDYEDGNSIFLSNENIETFLKVFEINKPFEVTTETSYYKNLTSKK